MFKKLLIAGIFAAASFQSFASVFDYASKLSDEVAEVKFSPEGKSKHYAPLEKIFFAQMDTWAQKDTTSLENQVRKLTNDDIKYIDVQMKKGKHTFSYLLGMIYLIKADQNGIAKNADHPKTKKFIYYRDTGRKYFELGCLQYKIQYSCKFIK